MCNTYFVPAYPLDRVKRVEYILNLIKRPPFGEGHCDTNRFEEKLHERIYGNQQQETILKILAKFW